MADGTLKAFLFDSLYDKYRGVISLVNVQEGTLRKGLFMSFSNGYDLTWIKVIG